MKHKWVTIIMGVLAGSILFASIAFMVTTGSSAKAQLMHDGILTADSRLSERWNTYSSRVMGTFVNGGGKYEPGGAAALRNWMANPHPTRTLAQVMSDLLVGSPQADFARRELKRLDDEF